MPLRPSCIMCSSDCDANSVLTNCQHFVCQRCHQKYPQGQCPRCQRPCKFIRLGASNFPRDVVDLISADPLKMLNSAVQALEFQRRQESGSMQRLKEIVTALNNSNRQLTQQMQQLKKENEDLKEQLRRERDEAARRHRDHGRRSPADDFGERGGGGGGRSTRAALSHRTVNNNPSLPAPGWTPQMSPSSVNANRDTTPTWGVQRNNKRLRDQAFNGENSNPPHGNQPTSKDPLRHLADMSRDDRFVLATPAITLRGIGRSPSVMTADGAGGGGLPAGGGVGGSLKNLLSLKK